MSSIEEAQRKGDFAIKPEAATATLNTSDWPLLLKVKRSAHCRFKDAN